LAHRSYHAFSKSILRNDGRPALYREQKPRAVIVGWDTLTAPTYRNKLFAAYQSGRKFDSELLEQLDLLPEFVAACGFSNAKEAGFEADDFIAAAATAEEMRGGTCIVASGDRDTFQLASERTTILFPIRGSEMARIRPAEVRERYGVSPEQVPDFIAMRGDPLRPVARSSGCWAKACRFAAADLREYRSVAQSGAICGLGRRAPAVPIDRHHGSWGAVTEAARPEADLGESG
jgi:DNA polymerase-1